MRRRVPAGDLSLPSLLAGVARALGIVCLLSAWLAPAPARAEAPGRRQPVDGAPALTYTLTADVDFGGAYVTASQRLVWRNTTGVALDTLVFHVTPAQFGAFRLTGCRIDPVACGADLDGTVLEVGLPASLVPEAEVAVDLDFFLDVPEPGNLRLGKSAGIFALGNWHPVLAVYRSGRLALPDRPAGWDRHRYTPIGDPFFTEAADYDVTLRFDRPLTVAHSGEVVESGPASLRLRGRALREFAAAFSDRYDVLTGEVDGVRVSVFAPAAHARGAETALDAALTTVAFLNARVAPYPWPTLHIAETVNPSGSWDGQEYAGATFISAHHMAQGGGPGSYLWYLVAHEVVHQWFYAVVGNDQLRDPWLDEAPATQLAWLALRERAAPAYSAAWSNLRARWLAARATYGDLPLGYGSDRFTTATEAAYFAVIYRKGALFLDEVREALGDSAYFALLTEYYQGAQFGIAVPADLQALVERRLGPAGAALVERYFGRTARRQFTVDPPDPAPRARPAASPGQTPRGIHHQHWRDPLIRAGAGAGARSNSSSRTCPGTD